MHGIAPAPAVPWLTTLHCPPAASLQVVRTALLDAASVASLLTTAECIIVEVRGSLSGAFARDQRSLVS